MIKIKPSQSKIRIAAKFCSIIIGIIYFYLRFKGIRILVIQDLLALIATFTFFFNKATSKEICLDGIVLSVDSKSIDCSNLSIVISKLTGIELFLKDGTSDHVNTIGYSKADKKKLEQALYKLV